MAVVKGGLPGGGYVGKFGNAVFYESGGQTVMREVGETVNPRTPDQQAGRRQMGTVARGWRTLDDASYQAWLAYGEREGTSGYRAYMALTRRWLRVHSGGTPPKGPPEGTFFGDAVRLTISPSQNGSFLRGGRGESNREQEAGRAALPLPRPPLQEEPLGEGALVVVADRANSAGVVTEFMAQPVAGPRRKPKARDWKSLGFFAFTDDARTATFPLGKGCWALAYRFVDATSGRATDQAPLGATTVG